ncbi:MAG: hypothetical protein K6F64_04185, partial [Clostridia bacterium]|nr:hypothetical protein [Clostridia bacterium]
IIKHNDHPENCRLSTFEKVYNPDGTEASDNHHLAKVITCDLHTYDGAQYPDLETIDGLGNVVNLEGEYGLIKWISNVYSDNTGNFSEGEAAEGIPVKIAGFFKNIFLHIVHLFQSMLGL